LTLLRNSVRHDPALPDGKYTRQDTSQGKDPRFTDNLGATQSIATSSTQNDSGMFELNFRDERYLPFEGAGVDSSWRIDLPRDCNQFDFNTIADVIFHAKYTARDGGETLRKAAKDAVVQATPKTGVRLFSIRHEVPTEWAKFRSVELGTATPRAALTLELRPEHYPFWVRGVPDAVTHANLFAQTAKDTVEVTDKADGTGNKDVLGKGSVYGDLRTGELTHIPRPQPVGKLTLYFNDNSMEELWLALAWSKGQWRAFPLCPPGCPAGRGRAISGPSS
jgi:Tc toxin complex TcA C-terminal TcB-binding domain